MPSSAPSFAVAARLNARSATRRARLIRPTRPYLRRRRLSEPQPREAATGALPGPPAVSALARAGIGAVSSHVREREMAGSVEAHRTRDRGRPRT
ncbi:hypothetical protein GCM10009605_48640 [Nocardiopsis composta]